ncbi:hypothetical protein [Streptomyces sp. NPDC060027]|uniref:hypothetical protein n=1 Tax=Streptomyces sp. NPDC060027 TaxID=3347040 RepID=UPI0036D0B4B1
MSAGLGPRRQSTSLTASPLSPPLLGGVFHVLIRFLVLGCVLRPLFALHFLVLGCVLRPLFALRFLVLVCVLRPLFALRFLVLVCVLRPLFALRFLVLVLVLVCGVGAFLRIAFALTLGLLALGFLLLGLFLFYGVVVGYDDFSVPDFAALSPSFKFPVQQSQTGLQHSRVMQLRPAFGTHHRTGRGPSETDSTPIGTQRSPLAGNAHAALPACVFWRNAVCPGRGWAP